MELNKGHIFFGAACLIAGIVLGAGFRSCSQKPAEPALRPEVVHDTITVHDTVRIKARTKEISVIRYDTIWVKPTEIGGFTTDSVVTEIPISKYQYKDTLTTDSSKAVVQVDFSGYKARIDQIGINYQLTPKVRVETKKNGWGQFIGIGIGVGYGASFVGNPSGVGTIVHAAPEIGVHITYGWGYHW